MWGDALHTADSHHTKGVDEPTSSLERERKFDVPDHLTIPDLRGVAGVIRVSAPQDHELVAQYIDSDELTLARNGRALRHRSGGHDSGWHVKQRTPEGVHETQWSAPSADIQSIPQAVLDAVTDIVPGDELRIIATISTKRTTRLLYLADHGHPVAEIADDRVTSIDLRTGKQRSWREWEVELLNIAQGSDGEAVLDQFAVALRAAGAAASTDDSKLQRALNPE